MDTSPRPLPWVASVLYLAVLVTGVYFDLTGLSALGSRGGFVAMLLVLLGLELAERRYVGAEPSRRVAVALLLTRIVLFGIVATLDRAGFARSLFLLVPFFAYFYFGRLVSYALAGGCLVAALVRLSFSPGWYTDGEQISDLLMFVIGMVFAVSMAAVAAGQRDSRIHAERLLEDLARSHQRLIAYADQVADLATVAERTRLARDIHDSLGHHLTAITVQLEKAEVFRGRDPVDADRAIANARRSATQALQEVRHSVGVLRAEPFALAAAVAALADGLRSADLSIVVDVRGDGAGYPHATLTTLYRAVQEGLTNVCRHARARQVRVDITLAASEAVVDIADDGQGFDPASAIHNGTGLRGTTERVNLIGGTVRVDAEPGRGTRLTVRVPAATVPDAAPPPAEVPAG